MKRIHLALSSSIETLFSTERRAHAFTQHVIRIALIILSCFAIVSPATAQTVQYTQGKADQALRSGLRVDPSTLGMSIQVPIGGYPGRGPSLPISLNYSSKLWRINFDSSWETSFGPHTASHPVYAEFSKSGWTTTLSVPEIEWTGNQQVFDSDGHAYCMGCPDTVVADQLYVNRLSVHMPDGSSHELRKNDTPVTSNQLVHTGVYLAVDGSGLRYDADAQVLWLPDGSTYSLGDTSYVYFRDRNGNTLTYNRSTKKWADALGRAIDVPLPNSPAAQDYTYAIPGGTYTLKWRNLGSVLTDSNQVLHYTGGLCNSIYSGQPPSLFTSSNMDHLCSSQDLFNPVVLWQVVLPNGGIYTFNYNVYGEIDKVAYPTGGYERFNHQQVSTLSYQKPFYAQANRGVVDRWVSPSGSGTDEAHWHYEASYIGQTTLKVSTIAPDETRAERLLYASNFAFDTSPPYGFDDVLLGMAFEERSFSSTGQMLRRSLTEWETSGPLPGGHSSAQRDPRVIKEVAVILDTGGDALTSTLTYGHDADQNVIATNKYDYVALDSNTAQTGAIGAMPQGAMVRRGEATFLVNDPAIDSGTRSAYRSRNFISLPTSTRIKNAQGTIVAQSAMRYDEAAYPLLTYSTATGWTDPQTNVRANVTTTGSWLDTTNTYLETHAQYDQFGNVRSAWDAAGRQSQMEYDSAYAYAYPTKSTTPVPDSTGQHGSNVALTTTSTYDAATGRILSTTDANGQVTTFEYASTDALGAANPAGRLTRIARPDGGWTAYAYGDQPGNLFLMTRTAQDSANSLDAYQYLDGLGRTVRAAQAESGGAYIYADTQYDQMGRVWRVSNAYRTQGLGGAINPSDLWTISHYDALGRADAVTLPDGTTVQTLYQGIYTTVTDQAGKQRRQKVDALGRIVRVDEPDTSGNLGTVDAPAQPSIYEYDTLGNLVHIRQGIGTQLQHRYFKYDSFSRLTYERQVEQAAIFNATDSLTGNSQWTRKLVYDEAGTNGENNTGMLTSHYDARNLHTQYAYDMLGRISQVSYSDGTPTVTNIYDRARAGYFNVGRLSEVQTAAVAAQGQMPAIPATSQSYDYDLMGRVKSQQQTVGVQSYTLAYGYNVGGQLTSQTYPSGRVVNYSYDDAARLAGVTSGTTTYASNFVYGAKGALTSVGLGNGAVESFDYNNRLQLNSVSLSKDNSTIQRYEYKYGQVNVSTGIVDETKNNGQIARIEGFIGTAKQWQQRFSYDSLDRLSQSSEYRGDNSQQSYLTTYDFDTFGNRYQHSSNNQNALGYTAIEDSDVSKATNRLTFPQISYDDAGNITVDAKFRGRQYQYDANNRQKWTALTDGTVAATSVYDGAGQRVATISNGTTSYMVYDAGGKLVAEYGQAASSTSGTSYVFSDHQGSTRVAMNQTGGVISRHDYQPFGEEISANVGQRTSPQGYDQADSVRQKYAGMEKDDITGMSHTLWRKYDSSSGRWTSPDPYTGSMTIADPQSFNRYSYVNNDPINQIDPSGLAARSSDGGCSAENGNCNNEGGKSESELAYEQRLQNTHDAIAANRAANSPDKANEKSSFDISKGSDSQPMLGGEDGIANQHGPSCSIALPEDPNLYEAVIVGAHENSFSARRYGLRQYVGDQRTGEIIDGGVLWWEALGFASAIENAYTSSKAAKLANTNTKADFLTKSGYYLNAGQRLEALANLDRMRNSLEGSQACKQLRRIVTAVQVVNQRGPSFNFIEWRAVITGSGRSFRVHSRPGTVRLGDTDFANFHIPE